jgi:hypothetical protein
VFEIEQRRSPFVSLEDDVAAAPTITPRGTTQGNIGFSTESGTAVSTVAGLNLKGAFIYEAHAPPVSRKQT